MSEKEYMLVEEISTFRNRYLIPKEDLSGVGYIEAEDYVLSGEVEQFSQKHLGSLISELEILTEEEALKLFDKDNDYLKEWSKEQKINYLKRWRTSSHEDYIAQQYDGE